MAKNAPYRDGHRQGQVIDRSQTHNPHNDRWVKRDSETGKFIDQKADKDPFKGARREKKEFFMSQIILCDFERIEKEFKGHGELKE